VSKHDSLSAAKVFLRKLFIVKWLEAEDPRGSEALEVRSPL
jgi:hypothetical protein